MNRNQLNNLVEQYIERFEELNEKPNYEGYKWITFQKFADAWDINRPDFKGMFDAAFKELKSNNLLQSGQFQPISGITDLLNHENEIEYVREAFRELFTEDDGNILAREKRIYKFVEKINQKTLEYDPDTKFRKQNLRSALFYLNLWKPNDNFIYKATEAERFAEAIEFSDDFGQGASFNLVKYYKMCNEVLEALVKNKELLECHDDRLEKLEIEFDDELHILVYDLMYCSAADAYNFYSKLIIRKSKPAERKVLAELDKLEKYKEEVLAKIRARENLNLKYPDVTGEKAIHKKFGEGIVEKCEADTLTISFECGMKELKYSTCIENNIISFNMPSVLKTKENILDNAKNLKELKLALDTVEKKIKQLEGTLK